MFEEERAKQAQCSLRGKIGKVEGFSLLSLLFSSNNKLLNGKRETKQSDFGTVIPLLSILMCDPFGAADSNEIEEIYVSSVA